MKSGVTCRGGGAGVGGVPLEAWKGVEGGAGEKAAAGLSIWVRREKGNTRWVRRVRWRRRDGHDAGICSAERW